MTNDIVAHADSALIELAAGDTHRPVFHFVALAGWLNDPNGLGRWGDRYHLFYQHNPLAPVHADITWGHASSVDLVHWRDEPIALAPSEGPDQDGCWSGVLVDDHGVPTVVYSGNRGGQQRACLAIGDSDLRTWTKYPGNPVIPGPPDDLDVTEYRDHTVWREGDEWVQLMGAGIRDEGGAVLRYRSADLRTWSYDGIHLAADPRASLETGSVWECPDFFPLGDGHVLIASAWSEGRTIESFYHSGSYAGGVFSPGRLDRLDYGANYFYAPQSFADHQGRRVAFGWIQEGRTAQAVGAAGWSGVMSLPRVLQLGPEGAVHQEPAPEVATLREVPSSRWSGAWEQGSELELGRRGTELDIEADVLLGETGTFTLWVRRTEDGATGTAIVVDATSAIVSIDRSRSTADPSAETSPLSGHLPLDDAGRVRLRVIVDRSVIEVFANGRALTARVYPDVPDADRAVAASDADGVVVERIETWGMRGIWEEARTALRPSSVELGG